MHLNEAVDVYVWLCLSFVMLCILVINFNSTRQQR